MISQFTIARIPRLLFGADAFDSFVEEIEAGEAFPGDSGALNPAGGAEPTGCSHPADRAAARTPTVGSGIALISGKSWFPDSSQARVLRNAAAGNGIREFAVSGEPSPESIDAIVDELRSDRPAAVIAVGGGSVIDTGKAVSAMIPVEGSVADYLEGVGTKKPDGRKVPFIAVPTTSGTGSEATKNAVISRIGEEGFKKSLRHDAYVPDLAVIDPRLIMSCPKSVTAASGLDAVTQLIEGFVSTKASPFTDALAREGLRLAGRSLPRVVEDGSDMEARSEIAFAAYASGIVLANAGLGVVHGIASPLGAAVDIPHGVVCGTLIGSASRRIVRGLEEKNDEASRRSLAKYAEAGALLSGSEKIGSEDASGNRIRLLLDLLDRWIADFRIPAISGYGVDEKMLSEVAGASGLKNTPVELTGDDIAGIIEERMQRSGS